MQIRWAHLYDRIYAELGKDYEAESKRILALADAHGLPAEGTMLDVACGTGAHLPHLTPRFTAVGIDLDPGMLDVAQQRLPGVEFHRADMRDLDLHRPFDLVTCLFGAIGYMRGLDELKTAISTMARHLAPGGLFLLEPWIFPEDYEPGHLHTVHVDDEQLKASRYARSERIGDVMRITFDFLVATPDLTEHFRELHDLTMFKREHYEESMRTAGLGVEFEEEGLMKRGLFVGVAP